MNLSKYTTILCDCDGVLWHLNDPIASSIRALKALQSLGKSIFFITNNSTKSREDISKKLNRFGYSASPSQAYTPSTLAPHYLKAHYPEVSNVFLIGMPVFRLSLESAGFSVTHSSDLSSSKVSSVDELDQLSIDRDINCVMVGLDLGFNYFTSVYASLCVQNGAKLVASNDDMYFGTPCGKIPGAGCIVSYIESATDVKADVFGKPRSFMLDAVIQENGIDKNKTLMVGDRMNTDVLFGVNAGVDTLLVETGVHKASDVQSYPFEPTYVLPEFSDILS